MTGQNLFLDVIENHIPLLLSKNTIKKTNIYIDVANDQIIILNKINTNKVYTTDYWGIPIGKKNQKWKENHVFEQICHNCQQTITTSLVLKRFIKDNKQIKAKILE